MSAPRVSVVVAGSRPEGPAPAFFAALAPLDGTVEVIVATGAPAGLAGRLPASVRIVSCADPPTVPRLRAAGVRAARAPVVVLTEDFCVPAAGWLDALEEARTAAGAGVAGGPVLRTSGSAVQWARTLQEYGRFLGVAQVMVVPDVAAVNASYDAAMLSAALAGTNEFVETHVHARLRDAGAKFVHAPAAVVFDESVYPLGASARAQFHHGRLFGGRRVAGAGALSRIGRAAVCVVVPAIVFARIGLAAARSRRVGILLRAALPLLILLGAWAAGECVGSLRGEGRSAERWT